MGARPGNKGGGETVSSLGSPAETAATLVEAYRYQDKRERHLRRGAVERAIDAGERAMTAMAESYEREFPHVVSARARRAGAAFMLGLFVQDEIENRAMLEDRSLTPALVTRQPARSVDPLTDPRWALVVTLLGCTCHSVGIDDRYAHHQASFWARHGQAAAGWRSEAMVAHDYKLEAMLDSPRRTVRADLGERFVAGVELHDDWNATDDASDLEQLVTEYYRTIAACRKAGGR